MSYVILPETHKKYYKNFCSFKMNVICTTSNHSGYVPHTIVNIHLGIESCSEGNFNINGITQLLNAKVPVEIDSYDGFKVVRIGAPKNISLPNEEACTLMRDDLEKNNGVMAYWDSNSIAFVVRNSTTAKMIHRFLASATEVSYYNKDITNLQNGLVIK